MIEQELKAIKECLDAGLVTLEQAKQVVEKMIQNRADELRKEKERLNEELHRLKISLHQHLLNCELAVDNLDERSSVAYFTNLKDIVTNIQLEIDRAEKICGNKALIEMVKEQDK